MKQRLYYRVHGNERGYPIDLVPFGGVAKGALEIMWPPDMQVSMSIAGYQEVLQASEPVELATGCIMKVASLAGLAILKLIAWSDRGPANPKDAHDLYQIITQYAEAGNVDRLYGDEFSVLENADHDPELAGAFLLGKDLARLASAATYRRLMEIFQRDYERLKLEMLKSVRHLENAEQAVDVRMRYFMDGMRMGTSDR